MNSKELLNELNKFKNSNYNVVLIDGPWGSGKTYLINKYINENKDKISIYYVSMLGKKNVDDINTSLYSEVNKNSKSNITGLIPSAINALSNITKDKDLDFVLKLNNKEANCIVILDDLERYASSDYDEFLAYISNLVLRGSKIICVSNLLELGSGERYNFNLYKEKIFDRVYKAELFNKDVINEKFSNLSKYLDNEIDKLFNNNFRIVEKSYNFSNEVISHLLESKVNLSDFDYKAIIFYSTILLNVYFDNKKLRLEDFKIRPETNTINYNKSVFSLEDDAWSSIFIYEYSLNTNYIYKYENDYIFISKLLKAYLFSKYDELINYYNHKFITIDNLESINVITLNNLIDISGLINDENYNFILNCLFNKLDKSDLISKFLFINSKSLNDISKKLFNELIYKINEHKEADFINSIDKLYEEKEYDNLFALINNNIDLLTNNVDNQIKDWIIDNNFLLEFTNLDYVNKYRTYIINLFGIYCNSSLKDEALEYLKKQKNNSDLRDLLIKKLSYIKEEISD